MRIEKIVETRKTMTMEGAYGGQSQDFRTGRVDSNPVLRALQVRPSSGQLGLLPIFLVIFSVGISFTSILLCKKKICFSSLRQQKGMTGAFSL